MRLIFIVLLVANLGFALVQLLMAPEHKEVKSVVAAFQNYGNLQTLNERDASNRVRVQEQKKKNTEQPLGDDEKCQLVGPYAELLHAEYLVERLNALEVAAVVKHVEIADGKTYWVYLKPEMSDKEALRRLYEIQAKAIDDAYIIPSGELANGISFGQFGDQKDADAKLTAIRAQGYSAEIKELPKSHTETWVEVREKSGQKINEEKWLELLKEEKAIERRKNYCLGVANP